jgi:uncharacterized protein Usg
MQQNIKFLKEIFTNFDDDPKISNSFWLHPEHKYLRMMDVLFHSVTKFDNLDINNPFLQEEVTTITNQIYYELNDFYTNNQQYCWRLHDVHFHPDFAGYVNCPFTCLAEITEFLDKILKENFAS